MIPNILILINYLELTNWTNQLENGIEGVFTGIDPAILSDKD